MALKNVTCTNCNRQYRIPSDKSIVATCPYCKQKKQYKYGVIFTDKKNLQKEYLNKFLPNLIGIFFIFLLAISISSFLIANYTWQNVSKKYIINKNEVGKSSNETQNENLKFNQSKIAEDGLYLRELRSELKIAQLELDNKIKQKKSNSEIMLSSDKRDGIQYSINKTMLDSTYLSSVIYENQFNQKYGSNSSQSVIQPIFKIPKEIASLENIYGIQQIFLLRPFYAYFSKIYLTREEQNNTIVLFKNIVLSTFSFLSILLFLITGYKYFTFISSIKK